MMRSGQTGAAVDDTGEMERGVDRGGGLGGERVGG